MEGKIITDYERNQRNVMKRFKDSNKNSLLARVIDRKRRFWKQPYRSDFEWKIKRDKILIIKCNYFFFFFIYISRHAIILKNCVCFL